RRARDRRSREPVSLSGHPGPGRRDDGKRRRRAHRQDGEEIHGQGQVSVAGAERNADHREDRARQSPHHGLIGDGAVAVLLAFALPGIPDVTPEADLAALVRQAVGRSGRTIEHGDVFVVAQKIVSKAEGAMVRLADVVPSPLAAEWAAANAKDPRVVEVILRWSRRVVCLERGILIAETRHGFVCANAGVDASNVEPGYVTVLPSDCDAS